MHYIEKPSFSGKTLIDTTTKLAPEGAVTLPHSLFAIVRKWNCSAQVLRITLQPTTLCFLITNLIVL